ncbi:MAG: DUF3795 domain-containing protein [Syntrophales bacterium]|nr:DUF3795 domain-containing protein [Syntrophales bacterium]
MEHTDAVRRLTPCGLDCERCADYSRGEIKVLSLRLLDILGNYRRVAGMKAAGKPEFEHYDNFVQILTSFSQAACSGCRSEEVRCPIDCPFESCRGKGMDFCFQCGDYPCPRLFESEFGKQLRKRNDRMKEIGIDAYLEERMKLPRYP